MALIVGTDTYVTEAELTAYATKRGVTITGDLSVLLTKALDYLETRSFIGTKTVYNQPLQFPRILCDDYFSQYPQNYYTPCAYDSATVPTEIKKAQMIAALLIDSGYDLQSTLKQQVKRRKLEGLEIEFQDYSSSAEQHRSLNDILAPFLQSGLKVVRS